ncbi:UDP-2,3-diacylglucosamine diphosphatase [Cardiobacteriaceae bacterium TAE3-ERU3]|nr:UDP-2,3-diacylglucosamine diphosphatase [Cardiobacteriaceae bacterium TAE3-ERU3]
MKPLQGPYAYHADATVWFLADIHLSEQTPDITAEFEAAIADLAAQRPAAVYILGDLFDYWLGDDLTTAFHEQIAKTIHTLADVCPVYYQHGNRDFLIGEDYAALSGMALLPERQVILLGDQHVLLEHGDLLCTDDVGYQRLRRVLRHPLTQSLWRCLPVTLKRRIATRLRKESKQRGARKDQKITDVNPDAVNNSLQSQQSSVLIHGHTHRCNTHHHTQGVRYVLGDWHPWGMMLRYAHKTFTFVSSTDL